MKKIVFVLFILVVIGGFAYAAGDKEEISTTADYVVAAADFVMEEAAGNAVLPMDGFNMVVANTTRYNFIGILDDKKKLIA